MTARLKRIYHAKHEEHRLAANRAIECGRNPWPIRADFSTWFWRRWSPAYQRAQRLEIERARRRYWRGVAGSAA